MVIPSQAERTGVVGGGGGGGGGVQVTEWRSIVREGVVVTNWCANGRHKHSSIEVLYNILN